MREFKGERAGKRLWGQELQSRHQVRRGLSDGVAEVPCLHGGHPEQGGEEGDGLRRDHGGDGLGDEGERQGHDWGVLLEQGEQEQRACSLTGRRMGGY